MNKLDQEILTVLASASSASNWYRLDRALAARGVFSEGNLADIVSELVSRRLVDAIPGDIPGMPAYKITPKGQSALTDMATVLGKKSS